MGSCRLPRWLIMVGLLATAGSARADCTKPISIGLVKRTPGRGGPRDDRGTNRQIPAFRRHRVARFGLIDRRGSPRLTRISFNRHFALATPCAHVPGFYAEPSNCKIGIAHPWSWAIGS